MKVGVIVPQGWTGEYDGWDSRRAWERTRAVARQAEMLGFESVWLFDHFHTMPDPTEEITFESFTSLAALGAITPGPARPHRHLRRVPQPGDDRQDDLDNGHANGRHGWSSASGQAGSEMSGRLTATASRTRALVSTTCATNSRSSPGCWGLREPPSRASTHPSTAPTTSRSHCNDRGYRSWLAATGQMSPGGWPPDTQTSSTSMECHRVTWPKRCR